MPKKQNIKNELQKEINKISDTVDLESINQELKNGGVETLTISKKTLMNISKWVLNGDSEFQIRQNLELSITEWDYLKKTCPAIPIIMQHSLAFAEVIVGSTLLQTAIGGKKITKKIPMKVHDYNEYGKVVGEHYELVEVEEEMPPNPYLLKFLAENKLSENFGGKKVDNSKKHEEVIEAMSEEEINAIKNYNVGENK